jgi:hypothetical protein
MFVFTSFYLAVAWNPVPVKDDPLLRMPGTQPEQGVNLEAPNRCLNCHGGYNEAVEPSFNWNGSMMAQSARDPIFWACLTVAAQDSVWAIGNPNAVDLCERCHFPEGWLGGRSDPPNASAMAGSDFDGLHCDFCHTKWDPFFEDTYSGTREGNDWIGYWDEATELSQIEAHNTYLEDALLSGFIQLFSGLPFFPSNNQPKYSNYDEDASGQYFISSNSQKRASFADANAKHKMLYSRAHKSKYFCGTCHDVSNPVLANLGLSGLPDQSGGEDLITEQYSASKYFHVERTFSEFMLSAYAQQGGAPTNIEFQNQGAPDITNAAKCQDCHMRDVVGAACNKRGTPIRPDGSTEHPNSGQPLHDLTGGNAWISHILASLDINGPVYDPINLQLLDQGPLALTLDLDQGETPKVNGAALKAGSDRAKQQLLLAATIKDLNGVRDKVSYDPNTGALSFRIQNNTAHKLISGFPEGRRMFVNIKAYDDFGSLVYEVNPYDYGVGTLKGFPDATPLGPNEVYIDELVYEVHPSSSLTGEIKTFHFVLADDRSKDNRIPPKGFDIANAPSRLSEPVNPTTHTPDLGYFTAGEYDGGYDQHDLTIPTGAASVVLELYYQGTSREYIKFLRDEINGTASTLSSPTPLDEPEAYIVQTDPFFAQLKAWGDTIWDLWEHNHGLGLIPPTNGPVDCIVPFLMTQASTGAVGCNAPVPNLLTAVAGNKEVTLTWSDESADPNVVGYRVYYELAGKGNFIVDIVDPTQTSYVDVGLTNGQQYCYQVTSYTADCESDFSNTLCATPQPAGMNAGVPEDELVTGFYSGKGNSATFNLASIFAQGDTIVFRVHVVDSNSADVSGAVVEIGITGPEQLTLTTGPSDAAGIAEASWGTKAPKKNNGVTATGIFAATVINLTSETYNWDGVMTSAGFEITP